MIGTKIAHYEITDKLGEGGMGVVYRAEDTKLNREVAIKVLPELLAGDRDRMERFRREAKLLAQLNHPSIAGIHGVEESNGQYALIMELAEGSTLADRLVAEPMPVEEALPIALQIAEALEAAHEKGIIHRDLKPANIKVSEDSAVKVLDFGLAKALEANPGASTDAENSPTLTMAATQAGVIMGTAAYMSPEQARGKTADKRADIWSFGVVLYEMLTGRKLFGGDTASDSLAAVLTSEIDLKLLPDETPQPVRKLVRRCLVRDRRQRLHDISDARLEIEEALNGPEEASVVATAPAATPKWPVTALAAVVVLSAVSLWALWRVNPPAEQAVTRFVVNFPGRVDRRPPGAVLSPDGAKLVCVVQHDDTTQLYTRSLSQFEAHQIPGTEGATAPFFSFDGEWVGFFAGGKLKKVSLSGGAPLTLCDAEEGYGGSWGPDDTIIFAPGMTSGLLKVSATGGAPEIVTDPQSQPGALSHRWPDILPGGSGVLFTAGGPFADSQHIEVLSLETGKQSVVVEDGTYGRYAPTGHLVYARGGALLAVPFDVEQLTVTGSPAPVLESVRSHFNAAAHASFSNNGSLAYLPGSTSSTLVWVDRQGGAQPIAPSQHHYTWPHLSPDGQRLAAAIRVTDSDQEIWILDIVRGALSRITFDGNNHLPIWTPDGDWLVFTKGGEAGSANLHRIRADGSGAAEKLLTSEYHQDAGSFSPDAKLLAFAELDPATNWDIWLLSLEGDRKTQPFLQTEFEERNPMISPDGRWIAYTSNESGRAEVYVQPFPDGGRKWPISTEGGDEPLWARNGLELFYRAGDEVMVLSIETESEFVAGKPVGLFDGPYTGRQGFGYPNYDVSADGQRFVMLQPVRDEPDATQPHVVLNWFEDLNQKVASGN